MVKDATGGFMRGDGVKDGREALLARNDRMLKFIDESTKDLPSIKLKIMELGCGRGGLGRFIACELKKQGRFDFMVCNNISSRENEFNMEQALKANLTPEEYRVNLTSFDDLSSYESDQFDIIMSNDSLLYSKDYPKVMREVSRLLKTGGRFIFSDLL